MKTILTLFFVIAVAVAVNAQTNQDLQPAKTSDEPVKKISYEIIPAKRVVTPTNTVPADKQTKDLSEIKQEQDKQKQAQKNAPVNRVTTQDLNNQELQKKQEVYELKDDKPKE